MNRLNPKISIITPIYNSESFIGHTIESVLAQTYKNWEMLIVDDCSNDRSIEIIRDYQKVDRRIKLFYLNQNSGPGIARNKAIREAEGDIIAFLDSNDIWTPNKLEYHIQFMTEHNASFSHTSYGFIDETGNVINKTFHVSKRPIAYNDLLKRTEISCLTAMYDVKKLGKMYMPNLRHSEDYGLWLSILKTGVKSIPLDKELAFYRQVKGSLTNNKRKVLKKHWMFLYKHEKIGLFKSLYYFFRWGLNGVKKYYINKINMY